jgi:hypothetical protein
MSVTAMDARAWRLRTGIRRALLLGPPLVLAIFEILHPNPEENVQSLSDVATWFAVFHMIQLPLIALVAMSVVLFADEFGLAGAWTTRLGIGAFLVFFSAYDAVAGIGTGLAMRDARDLPAAQQEAVFNIVKEWPALDPAVFWLSVVGSVGWAVAVAAVAVTARRVGVPTAEWVLLALAALFLLAGHPAPFGSIAFGALFLAAALHELRAARPKLSPAVR